MTWRAVIVHNWAGFATSAAADRRNSLPRRACERENEKIQGSAITERTGLVTARLRLKIACNGRLTMRHDDLPTEIKIDRRGVVAVIVRDGRLLVIRRSLTVLAPGMYCFPGGGIEAGESEAEALVRELHEELGCAVRPVRRLGEHVSSWRMHLTWWLAELDEAVEPVANLAEVESVHWLTLEEMETLPDQLESNLRFIEAVRGGEVELEL